MVMFYFDSIPKYDFTIRVILNILNSRILWLKKILWFVLPITNIGRPNKQDKPPRSFINKFLFLVFGQLFKCETDSPITLGNGFLTKTDTLYLCSKRKF